MDAQPPQVEVSIAADPETVWRALRDPELIRRWHGWELDGLDEEIRTIFLDGVTENPQAMTFEAGGADRFSLHRAGDRTVLRITRAPLGANPEWDDFYDDITEGWRSFAEQLGFALERHDLAERRTATFDGALESQEPLVEALGLAAVADVPVGSGYAAVTTFGEQLDGEVRYRTAAQLGLTVDAAGDGLLILAQQPTTVNRPDGGVLILLTAYELDDGAFAAMAARWTAWWESVSRSTGAPF